MKYINEGNVYRLISRSQLPNAEKFESWLFDEVVPSIREKGYYGITDRGTLPEFIKRYKDNIHMIHLTISLLFQNYMWGFMQNLKKSAMLYQIKGHMVKLWCLTVLLVNCSLASWERITPNCGTSTKHTNTISLTEGCWCAYVSYRCTSDVYKICQWALALWKRRKVFQRKRSTCLRLPS